MMTAEASGLPCCGPVPAPHRTAAEAGEEAGVLRALADPTRLRILDILSQHPGEVCVCDLAAAFPQGQPTISHHLSVLRQAGLVRAERRGTWAYYRPDRRRLRWATERLAELAGVAAPQSW